MITGTGRPPERYPDDEKAAGWRDIESVADEIRRAGGRCLALVSDVADPRAVETLVDRTVAEFGRIDILINNASAARGEDRVPAVELTYEVWKKVMVTNVDGTFLLSCAAARKMIAQGQGGSIVNVSSIASKIAQAKAAAYSASKAAVNALSRSMALDLAPNGIRVNAICPGIIDTFPHGRSRPRRKLGEVRQEFYSAGLPGDGSECAELVLFLVTDRGKWITGQAINIDGGTVWGN